MRAKLIELTVLVAIAVLGMCASASAAPGDLDPSFGVFGRTTVEPATPGGLSFGDDLAIDPAGGILASAGTATGPRDSPASNPTHVSPIGAPSLANLRPWTTSGRLRILSGPKLPEVAWGTRSRRSPRSSTGS